MSTICLNFQAHQPNRLSNYDFFKIGEHAYYEDDELNTRLLSAEAERCYLPACRLMQQLIELSDGRFKFSLALSGVFLEQCYRSRLDVIEALRELVDTGCVELLAMPYYASLSAVYSPDDFCDEIRKQRELISNLFGQTPQILWDTALAYSNDIAHRAAGLGLKGAFAEGVPSVLKGKSPCDLYTIPGLENFVAFYNHMSLSKDLAERRIDPSWSEYPLSPETFNNWISEQQGSIINLCLDFEILGAHQDASSGVFTFWRDWITQALDRGDNFVCPTEAIKEIKPAGMCLCPEIITRGKYNTTHDWLSNVLQNEAITKIYHIDPMVKACGDPDMLDVLRKMQSADHFLYMSMDGSPFSPFASPYDMYISYMNALADLQVRVGRINELNQAMTNRKKV